MEAKKYNYVVTFICFVAGIVLIAILALKRDDHIVIDTDTVIHNERAPIYTRTITNEFKPGDTLTSKENGAWILWDSTMIRELQVAYITDSGTIEILK